MKFIHVGSMNTRLQFMHGNGNAAFLYEIISYSRLRTVLYSGSVGPEANNIWLGARSAIEMLGDALKWLRVRGRPLRED